MTAQTPWAKYRPPSMYPACRGNPLRSSSSAMKILALLIVFGLCRLALAGDWKPASAPLMTRWSKDVTPDNVLPEYPRPQMVRKDWLNLNGLWDYTTDKD